MKHVSLEPAFVLHRRSYRETSVLVDIITPNYGRLTVIAKGVRQARSARSGLLQPFIPLLVSWSGRNDLMSLSHVETKGEALSLKGECLFAGFYLNELLMVLLEKWDAYPSLYLRYEETISVLKASPLEQKTLRSFEKYLLEALGYGLLPTSDMALLKMISVDKYYRFTKEQGFILSETSDDYCGSNPIFSGQSLINIAKEEWQDQKTLHDAKRLIRYVLTPLLGQRPIYSRRLFIRKVEENKNES